MGAAGSRTSESEAKAGAKLPEVRHLAAPSGWDARETSEESALGVRVKSEKMRCALWAQETSDE